MAFFLWLINDINGGYQNHFRSGMIFSKGNESISYLLESKVNDSSPAGRADVTVPRRVNVIHFFGGIKLDANVAGNFEGFPKTCKCMTFGLVSYTDP